MLLLIFIAFVAGLVPRLLARQQLILESSDRVVSSVELVTPAPGGRTLSASLPAEIKPYQEALIYARASGYVKRWLVDLGDQVRTGQLLAEIDTPELNQQLAQARSKLLEAQAARELARTTADRWNRLVRNFSVSEQEATEKQADLDLKSAIVEGARADVRRLEDLTEFGRVIAPFDGTITRRQTNVGQLITAGSAGSELFRLAQTGKLRVYVRVPEAMSRAVARGQSASVSVTEHPGRDFPATVVRTAGAIEPESRTLLTELELDNRDGQVLAGSYAEVRLTDNRSEAVLTLPATAVLFRAEGLQVGVVSADNKVELRAIKLGRDLGPTVEVVDGLQPADRVILHPWDSLTDGDRVQLANGQTRPGVN